MRFLVVGLFFFMVAFLPSSWLMMGTVFAQQQQQQQNNQRKCNLKESWQPFVMVMSERTGSSWQTELLNLHPSISMAGEIFNPGEEGCNSTSSCVLKVCEFFNNNQSNELFLDDSSKHSISARGFKLKYAYCASKENPHSSLYFNPNETNKSIKDKDIRDACFHGSVQDNTHDKKNSIYHEYFALFSSLRGAKIICSLRRNAVDLGISKYFQLLLNKYCGTNNIRTKEDEQCWRKNVISNNFAADPETIARFVRTKHVEGKLASRLCEMLSEQFPTFFLWYEDFAEYPELGYQQLLSFLLGRKPYWFFQDTPLPKTAMVPVVQQLDQMIMNSDEVVKALEASGFSFYLQTSRSIDYQQYLSSRLKEQQKEN